jgi:hypothetical protein
VKHEFILKHTDFVQNFLLPISKLSDDIVLTVASDKITTVCSTVDTGVVMCAEHKGSFNVNNDIKLNIPDVKRFLKLLDSLEVEDIRLTVKDNHLSYKDKKIKFNYFLLEDGFINKCPVSPSKIRALESDVEFNLTSEKLSELLRSQSIVTDATKVYFFVNDNEVYAELNDRERQNINNITLHVTDTYIGDFNKPLIVDLQALRLLLGLRNNYFTVKVNNKVNVFLFDIEESDTSIRFAVSTLIK